jgi:hypothetical protein
MATFRHIFHETWLSIMRDIISQKLSWGNEKYLKEHYSY